MWIEKYKCDLCGVELDGLHNSEEIELHLTSENYDKKFTYYVCPFCAAIFKGIEPKEMKTMFNDYIQELAKNATK